MELAEMDALHDFKQKVDAWEKEKADGTKEPVDADLQAAAEDDFDEAKDDDLEGDLTNATSLLDDACVLLEHLMKLGTHGKLNPYLHDEISRLAEEINVFLSQFLEDSTTLQEEDR